MTSAPTASTVLFVTSPIGQNILFTRFVTGNEFLRRITRLGRAHSIAVRFEQRHGKGSHGMLHYGSRKTTLKDLRKEISPGRPAARHAPPARAKPALFRRVQDTVMLRTICSYPAILNPDEDGRLVVHFPEALTDGADEAVALREAADCLCEALASLIGGGEETGPDTPRVGSASRLARSDDCAENGPLPSIAPAPYDDCRSCRAARDGLAHGGAPD
jgi:hypothetical protein